jgi:hypothetical protein
LVAAARLMTCAIERRMHSTRDALNWLPTSTYCLWIDTRSIDGEGEARKGLRGNGRLGTTAVPYFFAGYWVAHATNRQALCQG